MPPGLRKTEGLPLTLVLMPDQVALASYTGRRLVKRS